MAEFLQTGGDPEWLLGLHRAPEKLRKLSEINKLLAHRPWLITKEHIQVPWAGGTGSRGAGLRHVRQSAQGQALSKSGLFSSPGLAEDGRAQLVSGRAHPGPGPAYPLPLTGLLRVWLWHPP